MELTKCSLCFIKFSSKQRFSEGTIKSEGVPKPSNIYRAKDDDPINNELKIIFLLRKILELPQNKCCDFLVDYGDPCSWMNCCPSCSDLIEKGKTIFDQMTSLQKQFKDLQNKIKRTISSSVCENESEDNEYKCGVQETVRSFICQGSEGSSDLIIASRNEETVEETFYPGLNGAGSKQFNCFSESTVLTYDWSEVEGSSVITCEGDNCTFDDQDPLALGKTNDSKGDPIFHAPDIREGTENSCYLIENEQMIANGQQDPLVQENFYVNGTGDLVNNHTGKKANLYKCEMCGKEFLRRFNLIRHKRIHTGEKPYECGFCGKRFSDGKGLKLHERVHTGERPYTCGICGKSFSQDSNLKHHKRTHTRERPYQCRFCEKCFIQRTSLRVHERTHTFLTQ